jgi:hypothetical protein
MYYFYHKNDQNKEKIYITREFLNRLDAANYFANLKNMKLKDFLKIFSVSK